MIADVMWEKINQWLRLFSTIFTLKERMKEKIRCVKLAADRLGAYYKRSIHVPSITRRALLNGVLRFFITKNIGVSYRYQRVKLQIPLKNHHKKEQHLQLVNNIVQMI